jgi:hypothetical protein
VLLWLFGINLSPGTENAIIFDRTRPHNPWRKDNEG